MMCAQTAGPDKKGKLSAEGKAEFQEALFATVEAEYAGVLAAVSSQVVMPPQKPRS